MRTNPFKPALLLTLSALALVIPQAPAKPGTRPNQAASNPTPASRPSAEELLKEYGAENNPAFQNLLGSIYASEQVGTPDYAQAKAMFERSANAGDPEGQASLGLMYYRGSGVPQDYRQAKFWLEKAAAQGQADAQTLLGSLYDNGWGVKQDFAQARAWYEKAAAQGNEDAKTALEGL